MSDEPRAQGQSPHDRTESSAREEASRRVFAWLAAHALGGAIHSVTSSLTLLEYEDEGETLSDRQRALLRIARVDSARLAQLSDDLLLLTHAAGGTLQARQKRTPITTLVREAIEQAQTPLTPSVPRQVSSRVARTLPPALVDPKLARRALAALVENALRFSEPDTVVTVEAHKKGDRALIRVVDVGAGVAETDVERIFEPLYVGASPQNRVGVGMGLGLGLAVARAAVEAQGGRVWRESGTPHGSVFVLELPLEPTGVAPSS